MYISQAGSDAVLPAAVVPEVVGISRSKHIGGLLASVGLSICCLQHAVFALPPPAPPALPPASPHQMDMWGGEGGRALLHYEVLRRHCRPTLSLFYVECNMIKVTSGRVGSILVNVQGIVRCGQLLPPFWGSVDCGNSHATSSYGEVWVWTMVWIASVWCIVDVVCNL